ncbi:MAG: PD-(D/E)XK nuclease family protein [Desulfomonilaceae bacterium]
MKSMSFKDKFEKQVAESINGNEEVRDAVNGVVESRFDRVLEELRLDREKSERQWEANDRKWAEDQRRWEDNNRKWADDQKRWEANDRRWEENQKVIWDIQSKLGKVDVDIAGMKRLFTETIGALGARWGIRSEQSFRNALKGILEETTRYKVLNVIEEDTDGVVFGWPSQVELDIVLTNGKLFIVEIKSSVSAGDVATFVKKAQFYEQRHNRKADALVIISPMIDDKAAKFIAERGIISYSYASDVGPDIV